jgi:hypothetical protein
MMGHLQHLMRSAIERACPVFHNPDDKRRNLSCTSRLQARAALWLQPLLCPKGQLQRTIKQSPLLWSAFSRWRAQLAALGLRRRWFALLLPDLERFSKDAFARRAFFQCENGAAVIVVHDGNIQPSALF